MRPLYRRAWAAFRLVVNLGYRGLDSRLRGNDGSGFPLGAGWKNYFPVNSGHFR